MIKTHRVKLNLTKPQFELVREKQMESANCWNHIVSLSKEYYFEHKQWIKKNDIQNYTFDNGLDNIVAEGTNTVGVDLGEIHSIASVTNEGKGLIISNREGRSIK